MYPIYFQNERFTYKEVLQFLVGNMSEFYVLPKGLKFCKHFHLLNVVNTWAFCRHYRYFYMHKFRINVGYKRQLSNFKVYLYAIKP